QISSFSPAHVTQHHFSGQDQRTWVHVVFASVLGSGTVGGFEHGHGVGQVGTGSDTNTTHLSSQSVGDVVAVQVQCGDNVVLGRTQQDLLQEGVSNRILDDDLATGLGILEFAPWAAVDQFSAEFFLSQFVRPITEATFGELHDVALVNDGHGRAIVVDCVLDGLAHQALGTFAGNRLDTDTGGI